jgi:hypothetical protein
MVFIARKASMAVLPIGSIGRLGRSVREIGPYAALALLLPGGTLIAGLIWTLRHRSWLAAHARAIAARLLVATLGVLVSTCAGHGAPTPPPRPQEGLPSDLMTHRPDIMSAEHALRAAFLPSIQLTGGQNRANLDLAKALGGGWEQRTVSTHE